MLLLTYKTAEAQTRPLWWSQINDLKTLLKKNDVASVQKFLESEGYVITKMTTDFDKGDYYRILELNASKDIGYVTTYSSQLSRNFDHIEISMDEYSDYTQITIYQYFDGEYDKPFSAFNSWFIGFDMYLPITGYKDLNRFLTNDNVVGDMSIYANLSQRKNYLPKGSLYDYFKNVRKGNSYELQIVNSNDEQGDMLSCRLSYRVEHEKKRMSYDSPETEYPRYYFSTYLNVYLPKRQSLDNVKHYSVPLIKNGGSFSVVVSIGGKRKTYILDSGASEMSIDKETYNALLKQGIIKSKHRLPKANYSLADGSIVSLERIILPSITISGNTINNVKANVIDNGKPLLLGKSFLDKFSYWKVDNEKGVLILVPF
jgi:clan AA aspartic protease (TIGR02281 family)